MKFLVKRFGTFSSKTYLCPDVATCETATSSRCPSKLGELAKKPKKTI